MAKGNDEVAIARRETYDTRVKHRRQRGNLPKSLHTKNIDKFEINLTKQDNKHSNDSSDAVYWAQAKDLA